MPLIKIFVDGADLDSFTARHVEGTSYAIEGFTSNPSILRRAGVASYKDFATRALAAAAPLPVSLEVVADDFDEMAAQAWTIASWGPNAVVKIPVVNSVGAPAYRTISHLAKSGIPLNVTAVMTLEQVEEAGRALDVRGRPLTAIVSVFAGRIADTGVDPFLHMAEARRRLWAACTTAEMLWASPRQVYDYILAERAGCDIITMPPALLAKLRLAGKDLGEYSRDTSEEFYHDARAAGYKF